MNTITRYDSPIAWKAEALGVGDVVATKVGSNGEPQHARVVLSITSTAKGVEVVYGMPRTAKPSAKVTYKNAEHEVLVVGNAKAIERPTTAKPSKPAPKSKTSTKTVPRGNESRKPKAALSPETTRAAVAELKALAQPTPSTFADKLAAKLSDKLGQKLDSLVEAAIDSALDAAIDRVLA